MEGRSVSTWLSSPPFLPPHLGLHRGAALPVLHARARPLTLRERGCPLVRVLLALCTRLHEDTVPSEPFLCLSVSLSLSFLMDNELHKREKT